MDSDETKFLPHTPRKTENEPFEFGERTIFQLRSQDFTPADEFGTVITRPHSEAPLEAPQQTTAPSHTVEVAAAPEVAAEAPVDDPLARIEQKLDAALRQLNAMQHRIESLDATIARLLLR